MLTLLSSMTFFIDHLLDDLRENPPECGLAATATENTASVPLPNERAHFQIDALCTLSLSVVASINYDHHQ